LLLKVLLRWKV
jgi:hypothetical protein